jgi:hypothetical protein
MAFSTKGNLSSHFLNKKQYAQKIGNLLLTVVTRLATWKIYGLQIFSLFIVTFGEKYKKDYKMIRKFQYKIRHAVENFKHV